MSVASTKRKTWEDYLKLESICNIEFIDRDLPKNTKTKFRCRCQNGHIWLVSYDNLRGGRRCPFCYGNVKKTKEDYIKLAQSKGIFWESTTAPKNSRELTVWRCAHDHTWKDSYHSIDAKYCCCPYCIPNKKKEPEDYYRIAREADIEWLGPIVSNTKTKTKWKCAKGHVWETTYDSIRSGYRCQTCARILTGKKIRVGPSAYDDLQSETGFTLLSVKPDRTHDKVFWICPKGHIIKTSYHQIKRGCGCYKCGNRLYINGSQVSSPQLELAKMLGVTTSNINYKVGRYSIDIVIKQYKIGIEYDCWYWHEDVEREHKRDAYLIGEGWKLLHVKSGSLLPELSDVEKALIKLVTNKSQVEEIVLEDWKW